MTIKRYTYLIIYFIATVFFAACTSDDVEREKAEGEMTHVGLTITTRATGTPETTTVDKELIGSWWVVFVSKTTGNVQKIVQRPTSGTYVEEERVELDIPVGTYTLYSFANITPTSTTPAGSVTIAGFTFTEGAAAPLATDINTKTFALTNGWTGDIPMTGTQDVIVTGRTNETFSIEVVRMLAKMEFQFKNESGKPITVNSVNIQQNQTLYVPLLPNYTWLDSGWPFVSSGTRRDYSHTFSPKPVVAAKTASVTDMKSASFYMVESQADHLTPYQSYLMTLNVQRDSDPAEDLLFALDNNKIKTIYRNDHVIIPLTIGDYEVGLDVIFYPPIGGYPPVMTKNDNEFYVTFQTQGEFEIKPTIINMMTSTPVYYPNWTIEKITVSDPSTIFASAPHDVSGEILGRVNTNEGTAVVDVEIKVVATSQVYTRRIYIIRKNP